jgi:isopenicillin N synthase-like dioxygenase
VSTQVPVIDISALRAADVARRLDVVARIGAACRSTGFFSVVGHGFPRELRDTAFAQSRRFFALPLDEKLAVATTPDGADANRGYDPLGAQRLDATADVDRKESFMVGADHEPVASAPTAATYGGRNRWPDLPGFADVLLDYQQAAYALATDLLRAIALSLDLDESHFEPYHRHPIVGLRLLRYPPRRAGAHASEFGAGAHTDWGAITVLAQDSAGSLQLRDPDSHDWVDVDPDPDAFVVNLGDLVEVWTNGRYRSTLHRVLGADRERFSIALFCDLDADATIECLPTCTGADDPPRYAPTTVLAHLRRKYEESMTPSLR